MGYPFIFLRTTAVIPAEAGIHSSVCGVVEGWIPAFAGMTVLGVGRR